MNKEQFIEEIKKYLYDKCKNSYSVEEIDEGLAARSNGIQGYLNLLEDNEYSSVEEALEQAKEDFRLVFSILTYEEFKQEVINKLKSQMIFEHRENVKVESIVSKDLRAIDEEYKKAKESGDYFHAVGRSFSYYYYGFLY